MYIYIYSVYIYMIKLITYDMLEYYVYIYIYPSALNLSTNGVKLSCLPHGYHGAAWHDWDFSMAMLNYWWV